MFSSLGAVVGALVAGSGRFCSRRWDRLMLLLLLGAGIGAFVAGSGHRCSRCW